MLYKIWTGENDKTFLREMKENLNKWRNILCSWFQRPNIAKMSVLLKFIYRVHAIPIKFSAGFGIDIDKQIQRFT